MKKTKIFFTALCMIFLASAAFAQNITVKGVVTDASTGEPLSGAAILIKGTPQGVVADNDGNYSVVVSPDATLGFTTIGFKDVEVQVNGRTVINVALEPDHEMLEETIVVAFGTATKESFTGSAAVMDAETLSKSQVTSVTNALSGAVAGVQLTSSNGAPGATSTIRIRGFSSINAGQDPLIIVDGAPYSGDMSNINANDVESMTVLKDAASNALYGARGANGVIIITTKKAKRGEAQVVFDAKYGFNTRGLRQYNVITDPRAYYEKQYEGIYNYYQNVHGYDAKNAWMAANADLCSSEADGLGYQVYTIPEGQMMIGQNGKLNPNATLGYVAGDYYLIPDDWSETGYRKGVRQEYNLSVSGASDKGTYYASLGYLGNEGITANSDLQRITSRLRADYQAKDWLKVSSNMSYSHFNGNSLGNNGSSGSTGNIWAFTSQIAPIYPLYVRNADGSIKTDANGFKIMDYGNADPLSGGVPGFARPFLSDANALMDNLLNTKGYEGNMMTANGAADITILPGLVFTTNGTVNLDETRGTYVYNPYYGQFNTTGGTVEVYHTRTIEYNLQQLLNYNHTFAGHHNVSVLLGHEYSNLKSYELYATHNKMFSQTNKELNGAVIDSQSSGSSKSEYNVEGYFLRAQYDYDSKIFASASYRRDASSRFAPDYRWGNFWSVGAAWLINKEPWFNAPWVNELKLKSSFGSQGNDSIGSYRYTDTYTVANSSGNIGVSFNSKGTEDITWETNNNFNAGAEFTLFNKLTGSVEFFNRKTTDMLFSFSVAPSLGYSSYYANVGDLYNRGFEFELNYNVINTKNFSWDVRANATALKNRITKLHEDKKTSTTYDADGNAYKGYSSGNFFIAEDLSMYTWRYKEYAGVDPETGLSMWYKNVYVEGTEEDDEPKVEKRETTTTYADADYYVTKKSSIPDLYGGFGTTVQFYGFDFSANFSYQIGGYQYDSTYATFMGSTMGNSPGDNIHVDAYKAWTPDNKNSDIPRWQYGDNYMNSASTRFLTKASYLNIENISLGYTLPSNFTSKAKIASARIYVTAENLWYWSARQGFDPRQSFSGTTNATNYSPMRTVSAGLTLKF